MCPSQEIEYLGFICNSVTMRVRLTTKKERKAFEICQEVLLKESVSITLVSKLLGKFTSSFQAIKHGQFHYRDLERLKTKALKINKGNFDKKTSIDSHGKQDIIWWKNNILGSFNTIRIGNLSFTITTDASTTGWGAVFENTSTGAQFSITETLKHINPLNTGGTSNVCLLSKFCRLATVCGIMIYTKFQNNWILGNSFFNGVSLCGHW